MDTSPLCPKVKVIINPSITGNGLNNCKAAVFAKIATNYDVPLIFYLKTNFTVNISNQVISFCKFFFTGS
jgi:hypothetical protein